MYFRFLDIKYSTRYSGSSINYHMYGVYRFSMRKDHDPEYRVRYLMNQDCRVQLAIL